MQMKARLWSLHLPFPPKKHHHTMKNDVCFRASRRYLHPTPSCRCTFSRTSPLPAHRSSGKPEAESVNESFFYNTTDEEPRYLVAGEASSRPRQRPARDPPIHPDSAYLQYSTVQYSTVRILLPPTLHLQLRTATYL